MTEALQYSIHDTDDYLGPYHRTERQVGYTYCVAWRDGDTDVVKVGETFRPARWRGFINHGAEIVLIFKSNWGATLALEERVHDKLRWTYPLAFSSRVESERLLGRAGGWMETYRAPREVVRDLMEGEIIALVQDR